MVEMLMSERFTWTLIAGAFSMLMICIRLGVFSIYHRLTVVFLSCIAGCLSTIYMDYLIPDGQLNWIALATLLVAFYNLVLLLKSEGRRIQRDGA